MDEPFSAVDPVVRSELHEFFLGLQRDLSKTIILITHDIDEAIKLGDQVAILRVGGRLAQVGTPQHLLEEPADAFVEGFVGKDRGFRSLSFWPGAGAPGRRVDVVREVGRPARTSRPGRRRRCPAGRAGRTGTSRAGCAVGATFVPKSDTCGPRWTRPDLPYGLAVAVAPGTGRFAGVASARTSWPRSPRLGPPRPSRSKPRTGSQVRPRRTCAEVGALEPVEELDGDDETHPQPEDAPEPVEGQPAGPRRATSRSGGRAGDAPQAVEGQPGWGFVGSASIADEPEMRPEPVEGREGGRAALRAGPTGRPRTWHRLAPTSRPARPG